MKNNPAHILVIDDDTRIRELLKKYLKANNYAVSIAQNTSSARELLQYFIFDLIILDLMLPGETGQEFARYFRKISSTPILMLTAMGEVEDRIAGLELGADDYLCKPFEPKELLLRMARIIDRTKIGVASVVTIGHLTFNLDNRTLSCGLEFIPLTSAESSLLHTLASNNNQVMSREQLAGGVNERSIDVQIIRLRNKIESDPKNPIYLQTIRGEGYVLYANPA
jgi:two-component system phosphate regulon response regulator OmpR